MTPCCLPQVFNKALNTASGTAASAHPKIFPCTVCFSFHTQEEYEQLFQMWVKMQGIKPNIGQENWDTAMFNQIYVKYGHHSCDLFKYTYG